MKRIYLYIFLLSGFLAYSPIWSFYYEKMFQGSALKILGDLDDFRVSCNEFNDVARCSDMYIIPKNLIPFGQPNTSLGVGMLATEVLYGCIENEKFIPSLTDGDLSNPARTNNSFRNYQVLKLDNVNCAGNLAIQVWIRKEDVRHGLIAGKVAVGKTYLIDGSRRFLDFIFNEIVTMGSLLFTVFYVLILKLRKTFKSKVQHESLFSVIPVWSITFIFFSGIVQMFFPLIGGHLYFRTISNVLVMYSLFTLMRFYFFKYEREAVITDFLFKINRPIMGRLPYPQFFSTAGIFLLLVGFFPYISHFVIFYYILLIGLGCIFGPIRKADFFFYVFALGLTTAKILGAGWAPHSDMILFYVLFLLSYEIYSIINDEIRNSLLSLVRVSTADSLVAAQLVHDIRSPLGALKMLISQVSASEDQEIKGAIFQSLDRISTISKTALLHGKNSLNGQDFSTLKNLENIFNEQKIRFPESASTAISFSLEHLETPLRINQNVLDRILQNLVINAFEANRVTRIDVSTKLDGESFIVTIRNDGDLIPDGVLKAIIRYGGTYNKDGGTGLGLKFCFTELEAVGGSLVLRTVRGMTQADVTLMQNV